MSCRSSACVDQENIQSKLSSLRVSLVFENKASFPVSITKLKNSINRAGNNLKTFYALRSLYTITTLIWRPFTTSVSMQTKHPTESCAKCSWGASVQRLKKNPVVRSRSSSNARLSRTSNGKSKSCSSTRDTISKRNGQEICCCFLNIWTQVASLKILRKYCMHHAISFRIENTEDN